MPIPASTSKRKTEALLSQPHVKKPDADNLAKLAVDSINGFVFSDDSQIWKLEVSKIYSKTPKIYLEIEYERGEDSA